MWWRILESLKIWTFNHIQLTIKCTWIKLQIFNLLIILIFLLCISVKNCSHDSRTEFYLHHLVDNLRFQNLDWSNAIRQDKEWAGSTKHWAMILTNVEDITILGIFPHVCNNRNILRKSFYRKYCIAFYIHSRNLLDKIVYYWLIYLSESI